MNPKIFLLSLLCILLSIGEAVEIHRWKLDETSGVTAYDSIGGVHGTLYGGAYFSGGAGQFDGNDDYVQLSSTIRLHDEADWTISLWYKGTGNYVNDWNGATLLGTLGSSWWASFCLYQGRAKYLHATDNGYQPEYNNLVGTTSVTDDTWHNLVIRNYSNRTADVIVDGVVEVSGSSLLAGTPSQDIMSFRLDYFMMGSPGLSTSGSLKDVRVFNTALSNPQLSLLATSVPEPQTLALLVLGVCLGGLRFASRIMARFHKG